MSRQLQATTADPESFYALSPAERAEALRSEVDRAHRHHFARNDAYRRTVQARGGDAETAARGDLALLLRPAAITFKGYVEHIGPFPQLDPHGFMRWLSRQVSVDLDEVRWAALRPRYGSVEALLQAIEGLYPELGLEIVTSTGTSGRASFVARDRQTVALATECFFAGIRRCWGIARGTALVFVMPEETRVAMARTARFGTAYLGWASETPVYYTLPFPATPDRIRLRTGRAFLPGARGALERAVLHPFTRWADTHLAAPLYTRSTLARLRSLSREGRPLMLLGGPAQLHTVALHGSVAIPEGSRIATGGGLKEHYGPTMAQIRADLLRAFGHHPISDVYGMAEANWAAFECAAGNYHLPPWVHAVVTDDDDRIVAGPVAEGLLAFFDPLGGGHMVPPFFQTADRVTLVNGGGAYEPELKCSCGYDGPYLRGQVRRADLLEEAGCAAQV